MAMIDLEQELIGDFGAKMALGDTDALSLKQWCLNQIGKTGENQ